MACRPSAGLPVVANGVIYGFPVSTIGNTTGLAVVDGSVYTAGYIDTELLIKYDLGKQR